MSALLIAALATAAPLPSDHPAFAVPAVSDADLSSQRGGFVRPGAAIRRTMADANAMTTFQLQAEVNRATFDNWFATEGVVLIVNNQLAALGR